LSPGRWHHAAFTYDGETLRLYLDGKLRGQQLVQRPRVPGHGGLALGRRQDGYIGFEGRLDEARVYNRVLGTEELLAHVDHPERTPGPEAGVVARWEFNELSPTETAAVSLAQLRFDLLAPNGILALPTDPRPLYPPAIRTTLTNLERTRDELLAHPPAAPAYALAVAEERPVNLPVHLRGSHLNLAQDPVPRGFPEVLRRAEPGAPIPADRSGRLEFAQWLTSPANPLTARVIVNRLWQAHFGTGLVRTADNFGLRGETPSHPELLDWLARDFIRSGWDLKAFHRRLVRTAAYRQSSRVPADAPASRRDPENRLLSYFPRQRLEAEMVRDALLTASGRLDPTLGGSLVSWKNNEYTPTDDVSESAVRRTLYLPIVRDRVFDALTIFDFANPSVCTARRTPTVVSHQALFFLNSPLVRDSARTLATSLLANSGWSASDRIQAAYQHIFNRPARPAEMERAQQFLATVPPDAGMAAVDDLAALCHTLFAANEFIYRP
jgi:hypothetical protein